MLVLLLSMAINFAFGQYLMARMARANQAGAKRVLIAGLVFNIGMLGYYKYSNFFIANMNAVLGLDYSLLNIALPLGISFFTFTQIAFLVDAWRGRVVELSITNYFLFVTYFPHLLAGPIIHHREMMPQFADQTLKIINWGNIARGLILFTLGLTKKVMIADQIAPWANDGFANASTLTFADAWVTIFSYGLQLAFDFSGYTDMALGAALMMNIKLPQNFNAPYRATDIQDFWRRWHMTLSRFLRDYIYIPLGGNRAGEAKMCLLFVVTFVIGGLWHGAAWTFVLWGLLHGVALVLLHFWRKLKMPLPNVLAIAVTFIFVVCCLAVFRAASLTDAQHILSAAAGFNGVSMQFNMPAWKWLADSPMLLFQSSGLAATLGAFSEPPPPIPSAGLASFAALFAAFILSFTPKTAFDIATTIAFTRTKMMLTGTLLLMCLVLVPGATEFIYFIF